VKELIKYVLSTALQRSTIDSDTISAQFCQVGQLPFGVTWQCYDCAMERPWDDFSNFNCILNYSRYRETGYWHQPLYWSHWHWKMEITL